LVLIGGMTSATLFTLLTVPVFYTLIEDARDGLTRVWAEGFSPRVREGASLSAKDW